MKQLILSFALLGICSSLLTQNSVEEPMIVAPQRVDGAHGSAHSPQFTYDNLKTSFGAKKPGKKIGIKEILASLKPEGSEKPKLDQGQLMGIAMQAMMNPQVQALVKFYSILQKHDGNIEEIKKDVEFEQIRPTLKEAFTDLKDVVNTKVKPSVAEGMPQLKAAIAQIQDMIAKPAFKPLLGDVGSSVDAISSLLLALATEFKELANKIENALDLSKNPELAQLLAEPATK